MSKVAVETADGKKAGAVSILDEIKTLTDRIRRRAFQIFERRSAAEGSELDDWIAAERDLLFVPESELAEKEDKFEVLVKVPGFEAADIDVKALPDALIVRACSANVHGEKMLLSWFDLPATIDPDSVTADLNAGELRLTAPKIAEKASEKIRVMAA